VKLFVVLVFQLCVVTQIECDADCVDLFFLGVTVDHVVDQRVEDSGLEKGRLEYFGEGKVHQDEHEVLGENLVARFGLLAQGDL
jgi:hypothetical protein